MGIRFHRCTAGLLAIAIFQGSAGSALACMNIVREPPRPDMVLTAASAADFLKADGSPLNVQVGQKFEIRLPMSDPAEKWTASIAGGGADASMALSENAPRTDNDGVHRIGFVMKGLAKGDAMVVIERQAARTAGKPAADDESRTTRMLHVMVEPQLTFVVPPVPSPLRLTEADVGKKTHVTYGEDVVVTLPVPEGQSGQWRLAENSDARPDVMKRQEAAGTGDKPATRFVLSSMAFKKHLDFEFVPTPSSNALANLFRPRVTKSVSFEIDVYPAPLC